MFKKLIFPWQYLTVTDSRFHYSWDHTLAACLNRENRKFVDQLTSSLTSFQSCGSQQIRGTLTRLTRTGCGSVIPRTLRTLTLLLIPSTSSLSDGNFTIKYAALLIFAQIFDENSLLNTHNVSMLVLVCQTTPRTASFLTHVSIVFSIGNFP